MKDEYIKREDVLEKIEKLRDKSGNEDMTFALNWAVKIIRELSAADVAPLVLGHWTIDGKCNVCGEEPLTEFDVELMNFCPNCGAKMVGNE